MASKTRKPTGKQSLWLSAYLDRSNSETFLNCTNSAMAAGYKANGFDSFSSIGSENLKKLSPLIDTWMDDIGLSESALKKKHVELIDAKETKHIKIKGAVTQEELPPGCRVIAVSGVVHDEKGEDGESSELFGTGETIIEISGDALAIQAKVLDMGYRIKGSYAAENLNITGLEGLAKRLSDAHNRTKS